MRAREDARIIFFLQPLPPLHSSPLYPLYSQITSKPRSDPTTHLHKNLPWLSSIECSPIPQLSVPSIIFPQPTFPAYFPPHHPPLFHPPPPRHFSSMVLPLQELSQRPCASVLFSISKMLFVPLCLPNPPPPSIKNSIFKGLEPLPHPLLL